MSSKVGNLGTHPELYSLKVLHEIDVCSSFTPKFISCKTQHASSPATFAIYTTHMVMTSSQINLRPNPELVGVIEVP